MLTKILSPSRRQRRHVLPSPAEPPHHSGPDRDYSYNHEYCHQQQQQQQHHHRDDAQTPPTSDNNPQPATPPNRPSLGLQLSSPASKGIHTATPARRQVSAMGQTAPPTHIDFNQLPSDPSLYPSPAAAARDALCRDRVRDTSHHNGRESHATASSAASDTKTSSDNEASRWFGAIRDGKLIPIESFLKEHPHVLDYLTMTPPRFHPLMAEQASACLGTDIRGMDGLQVAIMVYKSACVLSTLGIGFSGSHGDGSDPVPTNKDKLKELVTVREAILCEILEAVSAHQLDTHLFGYFKNTTLHLAAFYSDANLVERILVQGADPTIRNGMNYLPVDITSDEATRQLLTSYMEQFPYHNYYNAEAVPYAHNGMVVADSRHLDVHQQQQSQYHHQYFGQHDKYNRGSHDDLDTGLDDIAHTEVSNNVEDKAQRRLSALAEDEGYDIALMSPPTDGVTITPNGTKFYSCSSHSDVSPMSVPISPTGYTDNDCVTERTAVDTAESEYDDPMHSNNSTVRTHSTTTSSGDDGPYSFYHRRRKKRKSDSGDSFDDDDNDNLLDEDDFSGIDDIFDDMSSSEQESSGYARSSRLASGAFTYYSSRGLAEGARKRKSLAQISAPPLPPKDHAELQARASSKAAAPSRSRITAFSPDLYSIIMRKAPQDVGRPSDLPPSRPATGNNTASADDASSITVTEATDSAQLGQHEESPRLTPETEGAQEAAPPAEGGRDEAKPWRTPSHIASQHRIGRHQGRLAAKTLTASLPADAAISKGNLVSAPKPASKLATPTQPDYSSIIPGEDDFDDDTDAGYTSVDGANSRLSLSSTSSFGSSVFPDVVSELSTLPLTLESRDAIINSLVQRFGQTSEKRIRRLVNDELQARSAYPLSRHKRFNDADSADESVSSTMTKAINAYIPSLADDELSTFKARGLGSRDEKRASVIVKDGCPNLSIFDPEGEGAGNRNDDNNGNNAPQTNSKCEGCQTPDTSKRQVGQMPMVGLQKPKKAQRKVSPSLEALKQRAYVSSAFGRQPPAELPTRSIGLCSNGNGVDDSSSSSNIRAANFASASSLPKSINMGRVMVFKMQFEQRSNSSSSLSDESGVFGALRNSRGSSIVSGLSSSSTASLTKSKDSDHAGPSPTSSPARYRPGSALSIPAREPDCLEQRPKRDVGRHNNDASSPMHSLNASTSSAYSPRKLTPVSPCLSSKEQPGTSSAFTPNRSRRRQSTTLKYIQNSGIVQGRVQQLITATSPTTPTRLPKSTDATTSTAVTMARRSGRLSLADKPMPLSFDDYREDSSELDPPKTAEMSATVSVSSDSTHTTIDMYELLEANSLMSQGQDRPDSPGNIAPSRGLQSCFGRAILDKEAMEPGRDDKARRSIGLSALPQSIMSYQDGIADNRDHPEAYYHHYHHPQASDTSSGLAEYTHGHGSQHIGGAHMNSRHGEGKRQDATSTSDGSHLHLHRGSDSAASVSSASASPPHRPFSPKSLSASPTKTGAGKAETFDPSVAFSFSSSSSNSDGKVKGYVQGPAAKQRKLSPHSSVSTVYLVPFDNDSDVDWPATPFNTIRDPQGVGSVVGNEHDGSDDGGYQLDTDSPYSTIKAISLGASNDGEDGGDGDKSGNAKAAQRPRIPWGTSEAVPIEGGDEDALASVDSDSDTTGVSEIANSNLTEGFDSSSLAGPEGLHHKGKAAWAAHESHGQTVGINSNSRVRPQDDQASAGSPTPAPGERSKSYPTQLRDDRALPLQSGSGAGPSRESGQIANSPRTNSAQDHYDSGSTFSQHTYHSLSEEVAASVSNIKRKMVQSRSGTVTVKSIGKIQSKLDNTFVAPPPPSRSSSNASGSGTGQARSSLPPYMSVLNAVPKDGFFALPEPTCQFGYLYLKILCMEEIKLDSILLSTAESFYFVIRNGINTFMCKTFPVKTSTGRIRINQEFRIAANPRTSITLFLRVKHGSAKRLVTDISLSGMNRASPRSRLSGRIIRTSRSMLSCLEGSEVTDGSLAVRGCLPTFQRLWRKNTRSWSPSQPHSGHNDSHGAPQPRYSTEMVMYHAFDRRHYDHPDSTSAERQKDGQQAYVGNYPTSMVVINGQQFPADPGTLAEYNNGGQPLPMQMPYDVQRLSSPIVAHTADGHNGPVQWDRLSPLAPGISREETLGCAAINIESMIDETFLRTLIDGWYIEGSWENANIAKLQLQMFFIPIAPNLEERDLPANLKECDNDITICEWHNRLLHIGFLSQRGGDTRYWRRRLFKLIGGHLIACHECTGEPRMYMDLNYATQIVDTSGNRRLQCATSHPAPSTRAINASAAAAAATRPVGLASGHDHKLLFDPPRRSRTHRRNNSDYSRCDRSCGVHVATGIQLVHASSASSSTSSAAPGCYRDCASDGEDEGQVEVDYPTLRRDHQQAKDRRSNNSLHVKFRDHLEGQDSESSSHCGVSQSSSASVCNSSNLSIIGAPLQHSFSIKFGNSGWVEFYAESEEEKHTWIRNISALIGKIPAIPLWLLMILRSESYKPFGMVPSPH